MKNTIKNKMRIRLLLLILMDICAINLSSFAALYVRFDFSFSDITREFIDQLLKIMPQNIIVILLVFTMVKLYKSMWNYASVEELFNIMAAGAVVLIYQILLQVFMGVHLPRSYPFLFTVFLVVCVTTSRFSYRMLRFIRNKYHVVQGTPIMIIGAGAAGVLFIHEINNSNKVKYSIKCIVDDDPHKIGKNISGVKVVGGRNRIIDSVEKYGVEEIVIAMPSVDKKYIREIVEICQKTNCKLRTVPGIYQLVNGEVQISKLRKVQIEDLLGRETIDLNIDEIGNYVTGKKVLVTGGGGSIGSELCRQIAKKSPEELIIVDIYENNAYDIEQELKKTYPDLNMSVLIASVRNTNRMDQIFNEYRPDVVYHAAAHKHVPLMEKSPNEAIKNNVFGTYKTAMAAAKYKVKKFVLISTDKAVNPTNIMGASKRICEMIIQMMYRKHPETTFVAVRFGNVLGSNGSVIPLFKKQIEAGGPITVTDPEIIRYFMTIPEAVSLVIQAGAMAKGGEIFVLDMGEPVKIVDLAKNMIRLSGYSEAEIGIKFTGLRPGEKLYEELLMSEEGLDSTENNLIYIGRPINFDMEDFQYQLDDLYNAAISDALDIKKRVSKIVPTYKVKTDIE